MLFVVLPILAKHVVILKLGLSSISTRITSLVFLNFYIPPENALLYNSLCFKVIDLKIKEALHINWKKPNLSTQQNHLAPTLSL